MTGWVPSGGLGLFGTESRSGEWPVVEKGEEGAAAEIEWYFWVLPLTILSMVGGGSMARKARAVYCVDRKELCRETE